MAGLRVDVGSSSSAWCFQPLLAVTGLGLRLSITAEIMAPAAFTPCIRACSTCKADQCVGSSVRNLGLHPVPPRPTPSHPVLATPRSGAGLLGGSSQSRKQPVLLISNDPRDHEKPGLPGRTSEAGALPFPRMGQGTLGSWSPAFLRATQPSV